MRKETTSSATALSRIGTAVTPGPNLGPSRHPRESRRHLSTALGGNADWDAAELIEGKPSIDTAAEVSTPRTPRLAQMPLAPHRESPGGQRVGAQR